MLIKLQPTASVRNYGLDRAATNVKQPRYGPAARTGNPLLLRQSVNIYNLTFPFE